MSSEDLTPPEKELIEKINKVLGEEKPKKKRSNKKVEIVEEAESGNEELEKYREKIGCVVASGQSKLFFGKELLIKDVNEMSEKDVKKNYRMYESVYSSMISDNLVNSCIKLFGKAVQFVLPIDDKDQMEDDLKENFLLCNEIRNYTGKIAYSYGPLAALSSTAFTVASHIDLKSKPSNNTASFIKDNDDEAGTGVKPPIKFV